MLARRAQRRAEGCLGEGKDTKDAKSLAGEGERGGARERCIRKERIEGETNWGGEERGGSREEEEKEIKMEEGQEEMKLVTKREGD